MAKLRRFIGAILSMAIMAGVVLPMQLAAYAETEVSSGYFYIRNRETGTFLDVPDSQIAWFTEMIVYPFNGNNNQYWEIQPGIDGYCRIRSNLHTNYFLDVANGHTFQGNAVQMFGDYGPSLASSNFSITQNDDDGSYVIRMYNDTTKCIAVNSDSDVVVQTYDGSDNQKWYLDDVDFMDKPYDPYYRGYYNIHNAVQYYATLSTYDHMVRNEIIFSMTYEQINDLAIHTAIVSVEDYELEQQKSTLNVAIDSVLLIVEDIKWIGDIVGIYDKYETVSNLGIYRAELCDVSTALSAVCHELAPDENGVLKPVPKPDAVTYKVYFLQQEPAQGRQIKIEGSDGTEYIRVVDNYTYAAALFLALQYQNNPRVYKIAPGYNYQLGG